MFGKVNAIILSNSLLGEIDRRYLIFTDKLGKLSVILRRGMLSKSSESGVLNSLNCAEILLTNEFSGSNYYIIEAELVNPLQKIKSNLPALLTTYYFLHVLDRLFQENYPVPGIFRIFMNSLSLLNSKEIEDLFLFRDIFLWHIAKEQGYMPELDSCSSCGKEATPGKLFFSVKSGGLLCSDCSGKDFDKRGISQGSLNLLKKILTTDLRQLISLRNTRVSSKELEGLSEFFLRYHSERDWSGYREILTNYKLKVMS